MNNIWQKKCEKSVTDVRKVWKKCNWCQKSVKKVWLMSEKGKQKKEVFLVNDRECYALSHFIFAKQS